MSASTGGSRARCPTVWLDEGDGLGDASDTDGELWDDEVGDVRAGRLLAQNGGGVSDRDEELWASDCGIDGAGRRPRRPRCDIVGDRQADD